MEKIKFELLAKSSKGGMLSIYVKCTQYGKSIDIDTSVRIFKDEWNKEDGLVSDNPNARKLNQLIRKTIYELEGYELDYDGEFTLGKLRDIWECHEASYDFYELMRAKIKVREDIRSSTKEIHLRVLKHLEAYQEYCVVSDLTEDYVLGFSHYLKDKQLAQGSIAMYMRVLRAYYNIARKMYGSKVPAETFRYYNEKLKEGTSYKIKALEDCDIRLLENYAARADIKKSYREALDKFLFMSYTGLRISVSIKESNISVENGGMWLTYTSVKTNTDVRIPLFAMFDGRAEQLINKYRDNLDKFFDAKSRVGFNAVLKNAARRAGLKKNISAHVARHTCASRLINKDVPVTTIQKVVGHRGLKMTMVYARTNESTLVRQLTA